MKRKTNFLKVILIVVVLFLFLIILKETSKLGEIEINETNETETLIRTETNITVVSEITTDVTNITDNKTVTIINETKEELEKEETKIEQGETKSYVINNKIVNVTLYFVVEEYAVFIINDEKTDNLGLGQTYTTKQGITIAVLDIWVQDFEGGKREVDFLLG